MIRNYVNIGITLMIMGYVSISVVRMADQPIEVVLFMMSTMLFGMGCAVIALLMQVVEKLGQLAHKMDRLDISG